jgi:hypothetical protein
MLLTTSKVLDKFVFIYIHEIRAKSFFAAYSSLIMMTSYFLSFSFYSEGMALTQGFVSYLCAKQKMIYFKVKVEKKKIFLDEKKNVEIRDFFRNSKDIKCNL